MLSHEDKNEIFLKLISNLEYTYEVIVRSANFAKDAATNTESKAENKYDTRGLEASYLAGAQSHRAEELKNQIDSLKTSVVKQYDSESAIGFYSLVKLQKNEDEELYFFVLPLQGGLIIEFQDLEIKTVTTEAPIGKHLFSKKIGDVFEMNLRGGVAEFEVLDLV